MPWSNCSANFGNEVRFARTPQKPFRPFRAKFEQHSTFFFWKSCCPLGMGRVVSSVFQAQMDARSRSKAFAEFSRKLGGQHVVISCVLRFLSGTSLETRQKAAQRNKTMQFEASFACHAEGLIALFANSLPSEFARWIVVHLVQTRNALGRAFSNCTKPPQFTHKFRINLLIFTSAKRGAQI